MVYLVKQKGLSKLEEAQPIRTIHELTEVAAAQLIQIAEAAKAPNTWRKATTEEIDAFHQYHKTGPYTVEDEVLAEKRKAKELDKQIEVFNLKKQNEAKQKELAALMAAETKPEVKKSEKKEETK